MALAAGYGIAQRPADALAAFLLAAVGVVWTDDTKARVGDAEAVCITELPWRARELAVGAGQCTFAVFAYATVTEVAFIDLTIAVVVHGVAHFRPRC